MNREIDISVVAACHNEQECLPEFVRRTSAVLRGVNVPYEIVIVDDGSTDCSLSIACDLAKDDPRIKVVELSRNFGHQCAVTAGMDMARGRAVVLIDADLQDPPEVIAEMVAQWRQGSDVVYGQRRSRKGESAAKLATAHAFYRILRWATHVNIPVDTGDFRLMDRRVVDAIGKMREHHRFIRGMTSWVGFKQTAVPYDRVERFAGKTKYPFRKMFLFSIDAMTSFSVVPLRLMAAIGFITMALSALLSAVIVFVRLLYPEHFLPGFPAVALLVVFFGGLNLFSLGVVGEYVGRIYEEIKNRPLYLIHRIHHWEPKE
jgi:dolichol-phosphate mannosyltransferase